MLPLLLLYSKAVKVCRQCSSKIKKIYLVLKTINRMKFWNYVDISVHQSRRKRAWHQSWIILSLLLHSIRSATNSVFLALNLDIFQPFIFYLSLILPALTYVYDHSVALLLHLCLVHSLAWHGQSALWSLTKSWPFHSL